MYLSRNSDKLKIYEEIAAIIIVSHPNEVFWSGKFIVYTVNIFCIYLIQKWLFFLDSYIEGKYKHLRDKFAKIKKKK